MFVEVLYTFFKQRFLIQYIGLILLILLEAILSFTEKFQ